MFSKEEVFNALEIQALALLGFLTEEDYNQLSENISDELMEMLEVSAEATHRLMKISAKSNSPEELLDNIQEELGPKAFDKFIDHLIDKKRNV